MQIDGLYDRGAAYLREKRNLHIGKLEVAMDFKRVGVSEDNFFIFSQRWGKILKPCVHALIK